MKDWILWLLLILMIWMIAAQITVRVRQPNLTDSELILSSPTWMQFKRVQK